MPGASRGTPSWATVAGSTTLATTYGTGQTHATPSVLGAVVIGLNASSTAVTCSTPSGWMLDGNYPKLFSNLATHIGLWIFLRDADGTSGDNAPAFSVTNAGGGSFTGALLDLTGLMGASFIDVDFTPVSTTVAGAISCSAATNTTSDFVIAVWANRAASPSFTWTSPLTLLSNGINGVIGAQIASCEYGLPGASRTPAGSSGGANNVLGAIAFQEAPAALPPDLYAGIRSTDTSQPLMGATYL